MTAELKKMIESIETELSVDDFFCFDDLIVFPVNMLNELTSFTLALRDYPSFTIYDTSCVIVARVSSFGLLSRFNKNSITSVHGMGVLNVKTSHLLYLHATDMTDVTTMSMIIVCMQTVLIPDIIYDFHPGDKTIQTTLVSTTPQISGGITRSVTTIVLQSYDADIMAKTVDLAVETSGTIAVVSHDDVDGYATFRVDTDSMVRGTTESVVESNGKSHFKFHSHPDSVMCINESFIAYPSGNDMRALARTYTPGYYPHIGHFVASPEGLWVIKPTYDFQCLMIIVSQDDNYIDTLLDAIHDTYTPLDEKRMKKNTSVLNRCLISQEYLDIISNTRLESISIDIARRFTTYKDSILFSVEFIKWSDFHENNDLCDIEITFEHLTKYKLI
jgi:hypothetical protein